MRWAVKPDGAALFFAQCPYDKVLGASNLAMLRYEWIWYKERGTGFLNANRAPLKKSENILVFYQKSPAYFPQFTYTINLKDYYPWYLTNEYIEVSDEVAAELRAGKLAEAAHAERVRYNKSYYSLDCDDGIEYSACVHEPSPQELLERMDRFCHLWNALNSLPEIQGRRVDAHLILGKSYREIARDEGVDKSAVRNSVLCGIEAMKKYLRKNL